MRRIQVMVLALFLLEVWFVPVNLSDTLAPTSSSTIINVPDTPFLRNTTENGSLSGYVTDTLTNPIGGARVRVSFHETYEENFTNETGCFKVTNIPICYCLKNATASKDGYLSEWVLLAITENTTHNFTLTPLYDVYVDDDADPSWYDSTHVHTVQEGIDNASSEEVVFVHSGTYSESAMLNKTLDLIGENATTTCIGSLTVTANRSSVTNFTIANPNPASKAGGEWSYCIRVVSSNTTISHTLLTEASVGVVLESENNVVSNNTIHQCQSGIVIGSVYPDCRANSVMDNVLTDNGVGMELYAPDNMLSGNHFVNCGLMVWHPWLYPTFHANITNNTVNGDPLVYLERHGAVNVTAQAGQIICIDCTQVHISNQNIHNATSGILMWNCSDCSISNCSLSNNTYYFGGGIIVFNSSNISMAYTSIMNNQHGIIQDGTEGNSVQHCTIYGNNVSGLILAASSHATLVNNSFGDNGIVLLPGFISSSETYVPHDFNTHVINNNTNNGVPIRWYKDMDNVSIPSNTSQVILVNCSGFVLQDGVFSHSDIPIQLFSTTASLISNVTINNNLIGILMLHSSNNCICSSMIDNHTGGGIEGLFSSDFNEIVANTISHNYQGIYLDSCGYNHIYRNNFIANEYHAYDNNLNFWDTGTIGNYWDDYEGTDGNGDGIGDSPYYLPRDNQDNFPLMVPVAYPPMFVWVNDEFNSSVSGWQYDHFDTIQDGLDAVAGYGTVYVNNGTYYENVIINKTINLIGEHRNHTIIDAQHVGSVINVSSSGVSISNFTIRNTGNVSTMEGFDDSGIYFSMPFYFVKNCTVHHNNFVDCFMGITLYFTENITIHNNSFSLVNYNFSLGIKAQGTDTSIITNNHIFNVTEGIYIGYDSYHNIVLYNLVENNSGHGIRLYSGANHAYTLVAYNQVKGNGGYGIFLDRASNNTISNNDVSGNENGIALRFGITQNNVISNNYITGNYHGIYLLQDPSNNAIINNTICSNVGGIKMFSGCEQNLITENLVNDNAYAFSFQSSNINNLIYHNNVINNTNPSYDDGNNSWDDGYPSGGNYWDDYTGIDVDGDGIGDTPFDISGETNQDHYPFMLSCGWEIEQDVNQSTFDRGFPIRHAIDGDWGAAQSFLPTQTLLTSACIYMRKFGTPEFNLTVELRENTPQGTLVDTLVFTPAEVSEAFSWFPLDFDDTVITPDVQYFIVLPPAPSGVTTSFGYEWGYAFGNQYDDGAFWFTRNSGVLWRDLPTMYEFAFKTYGYS